MFDTSRNESFWNRWLWRVALMIFQSSPAFCWLPHLLPPPCLLSDVHSSQDTRSDRSTVAPASCPLWLCCKQGVTSCLSLHLFFPLSEGPPGTSRGCDGSTADPCSYDPPGPQPGSIPACAATAVRHCRNLQCPCRVPGLFLCPLNPPPNVPHPQGCRHCHICQQDDWVTAQPWTHWFSQLDMHRKSHMCPHICGHSFTQVFNSPWTCRRRHKGVKLAWIRGGASLMAHTHDSNRDTASHQQTDISILLHQRIIMDVTVCHWLSQTAR